MRNGSSRNCGSSIRRWTDACAEKRNTVFSYNNVKVILSMNDIYYLSKEDKLVRFHTRRGLSQRTRQHE